MNPISSAFRLLRLLLGTFPKGFDSAGNARPLQVQVGEANESHDAQAKCSPSRSPWHQIGTRSEGIDMLILKTITEKCNTAHEEVASTELVKVK